MPEFWKLKSVFQDCLMQAKTLRIQEFQCVIRQQDTKLMKSVRCANVLK